MTEEDVWRALFKFIVACALVGLALIAATN